MLMIYTTVNILSKYNKKCLPYFLTYINRKMSSNVPCVSQFFKEQSDIYGGVTVNTKDLNFTESEFEGNLHSALAEWIKSGIRGIWFQVNIENSIYIPILVKHGFTFHHAKTAYVMLTRWLPEDEPNLLPQFPHTHIGVGGLVVNENNQVLVIQERYHKKVHWKLPGGYSSPGEDFADTARREVLEETGVETEFVSIVSFRHYHEHIFDCSDLYVVCHLRPLSAIISSNKDEIARCQWMDIDLYRKHSEVTDFNKFIMEAFLENRRLKVAIKVSPVLSYNKKTYHKVYTVQSLENSASDDLCVQNETTAES